MANTLVVHGCGGAGINICDKVFKKIASLGEGFANIAFNYLDTSTANISKITPMGDFWLVKTKMHSKGNIDGSGGERRTHAEDIMKNIDEYLDSKQYMKRNTTEFHIVVFSASGGTGSSAGPLLVRSLATRDIPTIALVIGDSSGGLNCVNTYNTLASLSSIAHNCQKPISVIYVNNHALIKSGDSIALGEDKANNIIMNIMTTVSLFLSGELEAVDNQDMFGMIDQSHYKTMPVENGLYGLVVFTGEIKTEKLPTGSIPTGCRILTLPNQEYTQELQMMHYKRGYVTSENAIEVINKDNFPIFMLTCANHLNAEITELKAIADNFENVRANIKQNTISGFGSASTDDATGLIF